MKIVRSSEATPKWSLLTATKSLLALAAIAASNAMPGAAAGDVKVDQLLDLYCRGPLLHEVQMTGVFADSKHFVDMPIKAGSSVDQIRAAFTQLQASGKLDTTDVQAKNATLVEFLSQHFDEPGTDMSEITPLDYQETSLPPALAAIKDKEMQDWAFALHKLWKVLGRVPNTNVTSSFLHATPVDDPALKRSQNVLVMPGGRFRESYYWDSYWIVHGLLASNMKQTARGVVNNLAEYAAEYGFVPNGGRIYYLTRSQPPMLSDMVRLVAAADPAKQQQQQQQRPNKKFDEAYLRATVPILEKEYQFWMKTGDTNHAVQVQDRDGNVHVLNRYVGSEGAPRPESYREDYRDAAMELGNTTDDATTAKKVHFYNEMIAGAETGWDFSSRWFADGKTLHTVRTSEIVPVDLNAIMHRFERNLMTFHQSLGNTKAASEYEEAAKRRAAAMDAILWNEEVGSWKDFVLSEGRHSSVVSVSDYSPLWAGAFDASNKERLSKIVKSLQSSGLIQIGGVQTTTVQTKQQWDAPNAWPPEQDIVVEGLLNCGIPEAEELAKKLIQTWVTTGHTAWKKTDLMFEKYNATEIGGLGNGGEYIPQFGFGWTNGVILKFLTQYEKYLA
uniref:Trehalase n=1 Tax=Lagenidium giganteum TaxID=4803 RepID=A0A1D8QLQ9_9STRA|nr:glycoside hydrolase 37 [Lagenidium giganteum]